MRFFFLCMLFLVACSQKPDTSSVSDKHLISTNAIVYLEEGTVFFEECDGELVRGCSEEPRQLPLSVYREELFQLIYQIPYLGYTRALSVFGLSLPTVLEDPSFGERDGEAMIIHAEELATQYSENDIDYSEEERENYANVASTLLKLRTDRTEFYRREVSTLQSDTIEKITQIEHRYKYYKQIFAAEKSYEVFIGDLHLKAAVNKVNYEGAIAFCQDLGEDWQLFNAHVMEGPEAYDELYERLEIAPGPVNPHDEDFSLTRIGTVPTLKSDWHPRGEGHQYRGPLFWAEGGDKVLIVESCYVYERCERPDMIGNVFQVATVKSLEKPWQDHTWQKVTTVCTRQ